ncbi:MAG: hypothetical protein R3C15_17560 [Thermoleophilia bacterium]
MTPQRRLAVAAPGGLVLLAAWILPLALVGAPWWLVGGLSAAIALGVLLALRT